MGAPAEQTASEVKRIVADRLASDTMGFASGSSAAMRLVAQLRSPKFSLKDAAPIIESDPLLAARVMRAANAAAYATLEKAQSIPQAVYRIGSERLWVVIVEHCAQQVLAKKNDPLLDALKGLWEHSLAVAILARDVAAACRVPEPEISYLAGLLHDVGKPVVLTVLLELRRTGNGSLGDSFSEAATYAEVIENAHRDVGLHLARHWKLPDHIGRAIVSCSRLDFANKKSVTNVLSLANALAERESPYKGRFDNEIDLNRMVEEGSSLLGVNADGVKKLCEGLADKVQQSLN